MGIKNARCRCIVLKMGMKKPRRRCIVVLINWFNCLNFAVSKADKISLRGENSNTRLSQFAIFLIINADDFSDDIHTICKCDF